MTTYGQANERRGWVYDPGWDYFVTESSGLQTIALLEAIERAPDWGTRIGLDPETVSWLIEHPTPGAYTSDAPPPRRLDRGDARG